MSQTIAIVGASLTGASAAATLREDGFDGRVVLLGAEPQLPYDRPPLSKAYLRGGMPFEKTLLRPPEFYRERNIETRLGTRVVGVDPEKRTLELQGGERLEFDSVLIATGGRNRRFPIPGLDLPGVYDLRTVADADRIRQAVAGGGRAVGDQQHLLALKHRSAQRQVGAPLQDAEAPGGRHRHPAAPRHAHCRRPRPSPAGCAPVPRAPGRCVDPEHIRC